MQFDLAFFAITIPAVIFAGTSKGGFGSGAAFASASILALVFEPTVAVGLMLPLLMVMDVHALKVYWRKWDWKLSWIVIFGSLPGVALGALLYKDANPDLLRFLIGAISILFVIWSVVSAKGWFAKVKNPIGAVGGLVAGATGGFTSFVSHAGGPPVAVYLLSHPVTKTSYQASTVLIFWVINMLKAVPYAFIGIFTPQTLMADVILVPFAFIGVWLGVKAHDMLSERLYFNVTYVLLTLTGIKLIWDSLS